MKRCYENLVLGQMQGIKHSDSIQVRNEKGYYVSVFIGDKVLCIMYNNGRKEIVEGRVTGIGKTTFYVDDEEVDPQDMALFIVTQSYVQIRRTEIFS